MKKGAMKNKENNKVISVANLPDQLQIEDPKEYIRQFRTTFLKKVREKKELSVEEAAKQYRIDSKELERIEEGNVNEQDMMLLNRIADFYGVDYPSLLFMFKLARRPERRKVEKIAAYHDQKIDEETQKDLEDFLSKLRDSLE